MAAAIPATPASTAVIVVSSDLFVSAAAAAIRWFMNPKSLPGLWYACVLSPTNAKRDLLRGVMCAICAAAAVAPRMGETYTLRGVLEFPGSALRGERRPVGPGAPVRRA